MKKMALRLFPIVICPTVVFPTTLTLTLTTIPTWTTTPISKYCALTGYKFTRTHNCYFTHARTHTHTQYIYALVRMRPISGKRRSGKRRSAKKIGLFLSLCQCLLGRSIQLSWNLCTAVIAGLNTHVQDPFSFKI